MQSATNSIPKWKSLKSKLYSCSSAYFQVLMQDLKKKSQFEFLEVSMVNQAIRSQAVLQVRQPMIMIKDQLQIQQQKMTKYEFHPFLLHLIKNNKNIK